MLARPTSFPVSRIRSRAARFAPAVFLFLPALALAQTGGDPIWTFQGIEDIECAAEIEDQNGDGVPDVIVETYDAGAVGDHIYCLSGASPGPSPVTIWSAKPPGGPSSSGGDGDECVRIAGDLDGDGKKDVLLGTAWGGRTAYGLKGTNGAVLWSFDTYADRPPDPPLSGWVYSMSSIPDADADGVPDVFFGCGSDNNRVYHLSGATGGVHWNVELADAIFSTLALDDVSGDGKGDVAVGVGDNGDAVLALRGGATATPVIWTRPMPGSVLALARLPDIDGDGLNDVAAGSWSATSVLALSGDTGVPIWTASLPGSPYVMRIEPLDDVTGDGIPELAVGSWGDSAYVLNGATGAMVWSFPTAGDVWAVARAQDVTGDGVAELIAGSFDHLVYLLDVAGQSMLWRFDTGNRLLWVHGCSDLNGNSVPDVFAGSQKLTGSPGGQAFLLEGGDAAVGAEIPMTEARSISSGIEVTLRAAWIAETAILERADGRSVDAATTARYERDVVDAWREGLLSTQEAVEARREDPETLFRAVSGRLPVRRGQSGFVDGSAQLGRTYSYRFALYRGEALAGYTPVVSLVHGSGPEESAVPSLSASPNPFRRGELAISFRLAHPQRVRLSVYDAAGREVAGLGEIEGAGEVRVGWDGLGSEGQELPGGVYFVHAESEAFRTAAKLTLLR